MTRKDRVEETMPIPSDDEVGDEGMGIAVGDDGDAPTGEVPDGWWEREHARRARTLDVLYREFPPQAIKQRTVGGGRSLSYVEGHSVIHRLNEATDNQWDLEVRSIDTISIGTQQVLRAHVALTIPGLGRREHIGVQAVADRSGEDLVKGCVTDALKKAATLFGIGLHLYGPDHEAGELAPSATEVRQAVASAVKRMDAEPSKMVTSLYQVGQKRGLDPVKVDRVIAALYGMAIGDLDVEQGRQAWSFLSKATEGDIRQALDTVL